MPGVESSKRREVVTPLAKLRGAILRFGPSAVKFPGRTHDNHCVTKGLKVSLKPFQRLGIVHVGRSPRPEDPKGRSPVRAGVGHGPEGIEASALQSSTPQIHPGGVFCADAPSNRTEGPKAPRSVTTTGRHQAALRTQCPPGR